MNTGPITDASDPSYGASAHYDQRYFDWQNSEIGIKTQFKVRIFAPHIKRSDTVVDFGCAGGGMLAGLECARRIGIEINDVARAAAERDHGIETYASVADVPDEVADVVVSNHALEHIEAPIEALRQLRPKVKPDGKLVLLLPIDDWRSQKQWDPNDINRHLYTWTPLLLGNALDEAGYRPEQMRIVHRTLMRGFPRFAKLPRPVFEGLQVVYSRLRHRQELLAVARPA